MSAAIFQVWRQSRDSPIAHLSKSAKTAKDPLSSHARALECGPDSGTNLNHTRRIGAVERPSVSAPELKAQIEAERAGRPFLVYRDGDGEQVILPIETNAELWIGRAGSADVRLGWDEEVSALHAQIEVVRDECTVLDDGLSRNGSFVNEERVHGRRHLR